MKKIKERLAQSEETIKELKKTQEANIAEIAKLKAALKANRQVSLETSGQASSRGEAAALIEDSGEIGNLEANSVNESSSDMEDVFSKYLTRKQITLALHFIKEINCDQKLLG